MAKNLLTKILVSNQSLIPKRVFGLKEFQFQEKSSDSIYEIYDDTYEEPYDLILKK